MAEIDRRDFMKKLATTGACAGCLGLMPGCALFGDGLRYRFGGELHRDFHASILDGYEYVRDVYGEEAIREVMGNFARGVHRSMHGKLAAGDTSELVEFWRYYLGREGCDVRIEPQTDGGVALEVRGCPALDYLRRRGVTGGETLCAATRLFNEELSRGTPFCAEMTHLCDACRQVFRREAK